ncbi:UDP-glucose 4-epimerase GalE [Aminipila butyrica]|uniref:UDP-glucose 4-epimerase n=1 Tax=Aminipila butyrica TaxID=433296 RepID=A0A858BVS3_9FIRM|nr:UDP-glucose 4-epimerase GalE [Aminipila butyrica]QIB68176.1 UDP-glucose 4-epimerase GalE [Aminipila butyrica]
MNILVTGGAGYIGSHIAWELQQKGYSVVIYDNLSTGHSWAAKNCELVIGDLFDVKRMETVLEEYAIDGVIHFAASSLVGESVRNPAKYYENNVLGSKRLLDAMRSKGVDKLVFSSSCATYGLPTRIPITESELQQPINTYGWTKLIIEQLMRDYGNAYGLQSIALRYFNAAGAAYEAGLGESHQPETHVIPLLLEAAARKREHFSLFGQDYPTEDGSCIRDYIHVKDLAQAHILALEKLIAQEEEIKTTNAPNSGSFDCFNLGTGSGVSVLELIRTVESVTGSKVPIEIGPRRLGDPPILVADNSKAVQILGWKPIYSEIQNIVESAYKWETIKAFWAGDTNQISNRIF